MCAGYAPRWVSRGESHAKEWLEGRVASMVVIHVDQVDAHSHANMCAVGSQCALGMRGVG